MLQTKKIIKEIFYCRIVQTEREMVWEMMGMYEIRQKIQRLEISMLIEILKLMLRSQFYKMLIEI